jgi:thioredoxin-dependent peroxiredoxin
MADTSTRPAVDPVMLANSTGIGQKLAAARGSDGGGLGGMSRKELKKLVRMKDGVAMMTQAPRSSSDTIGTLEHMLRMVPTTRRQRPPRLHEGDPAPGFSLLGSHGETVSLESLRGKPFAIRLTRAMGTTTICPACVPGLDALTRSHAEFDAVGAELLVVFPVTHEHTEILVDTLELPYPLYADEGMTLYKEYETGYSGGVPLPAWVVVDADGVIRFLWRATEGGLYDHYAESDEILDVLRVIQGG